MSQAARYVDNSMVDFQNLGYDSWQTVYFQRATVLVTELVLLYSLYLYAPFYLHSRGTRLTLYKLCEKLSLELTTHLSCRCSLYLLVAGTSHH